MFKNIIFLILIVFSSLFSQWTSVNSGLGSLKIKSLGILGTNIVAVTADQGIFVSGNFGNSWSAHPQNSTLPNFNLSTSIYDMFSGQGMMVLGKGFISSLSGNALVNIPITGIPNNDFTAYTNEEGAGIPETVIFGTNGGGVYYADNFASTTWTEIPGLNNTNAKTITGLYVYDPVDDEYLLVASRDGMFISPSNSLSGLSAFNTGLSGNSRSVNSMFGQFILTKEGIYILPDENGLTTGWQQMYPTGDFRTVVMDFLGQNFYFYGNGVGVRFDGSSFHNEDLTGITGGAITTCAIQYTGQTGGYLYVGTEQGGVFRKQLVVSSVTENNIVKDFKLNQNYPNPFNPSTKISWSVPFAGKQTLKVYDILGNEVATLVDEFRPAGNYEIEFNANKLTSGVYFYKLKAGDFVQTRKMIITK